MRNERIHDLRHSLVREALDRRGHGPRLAEALADKLHGAPNSSSPYSDDLLSDDPEPETYLGMDWEEYQRMYDLKRL